MTSPEEYGVEPVALVGLSCRVPGARDAQQFWANLVSGTESVRFYRREEQLKMGVPVEMVDDPAFVPAAAVLDGIEYFDAAFFGMTGREADLADPQHRLFLELAHSALEDAGCDPARYPGAIGVYTGTGANDYLWRNVKRNPRVAGAAGGLSVSIGNNPDYISTFTSYKLNLRGPSFTLHTACSTSLVAIHLACEAIRNGECDMALAGGVCIELPHGAGYVYYDGGITSPDGHCRPFDARAAGTLWGSGGGIVVLKRLADALADGDNIRAVVLGNAVNNDGSAKVGFSAPSAEGQADVVAQALGLAGIAPRSVSYVEAHGTATALGDPIEVSALGRAYGAGTTETGWCGIGSVKSNFGHLSQAAGVVGVIKTVLAMEHGLLPASLNYESPNPAIDFGPFYVNATLSTWDSPHGPRRAGISSFGIGGTNAHVILQEAPARPAPVPGRPLHLLRLSARTPAALEDATDRLAAHLTSHPGLALADVAYTLRDGRAHHPHRTVVVASDPAEAATALRDKRRRHTGTAAPVPPGVAFLFSGQGAQYAGMGARLAAAEPVFAAAVDECGGLPDLTDELLRETRHTQPALFTIGYALARLWESYGVLPTAMIGHSIGEYVAATLAGVFTLPDAVRLVSARGRLMQGLPPGSMLAVQAAEASVAAGLPDGLAIATVNGPGTCVVAGPTGLVEAYAESLRERRIGCRMLRTSHAFHSPMMEPILAEFTALVASVPRSAPTRPFLSNRTGTWITDAEAVDPAYWAGHLRGTVRFGDCVSTLLSLGEWAMVECGPGRQLVGLARMQTGSGLAPLPSLPGPGERATDLDVLYGTAGRLWAAGVPLDGFGGAARRVSLPTYPFERSYHWVEAEVVPDAPVAPAPIGALPVERWGHVPVWQQRPPAAIGASRPGCLLFGPADEGLAGVLRAGGTSVVEVVPGAGFAAVAPDRYTVRPAEREDYAGLLAALGDRVPQWTVHAWCLDPAADADRGFFSLLAYGQALAATELTGLHVDVVTESTMDVLGGETTKPSHATVRGVVTTLPLELPSTLTMRHLDVAPDTRPAVLVAALADEGATAVRRGRAWSLDYAPVELPPTTQGLRAGGTYLVTGGYGGIGATIAEDLARVAGARLVLVGRHPRPEAVRRIEAAGGTVLALTADVSDIEDLRRVRDEIVERFGRLDGIVHAAGLPGGGLAEARTRAAVEEVFAAKIAGTEALAATFTDLDFVALCSSVSGLYGDFGQLDYCAASAFLDSYAHSGRFGAARVFSIDWGGWLDVGMVAEVARPDALTAAADATGLTGSATDIAAAPLDHPILTTATGALLDPARHWVLGEHRIAGVPVLPGTGHLEIARAALAASRPAPAANAVIELREVTFLKPLSVPDGTRTELRVALAGEDFTILGGGEAHVRGSGGWVAPEPVETPDLHAIRTRLGPPQDIEPGYYRSRSGLLGFGPRWANLREVYSGDGEALARFEVPDEYAGELDRWVLHPALLDEATSFATGEGGSYLPIGYGRLTVYRPLPRVLWSYARVSGGDEMQTADLVLLDDEGRILVGITDFMLRRVDRAAVAQSMTVAPAPAGDIGIRPADGAEVFRRLLGLDLGPQVVVTARTLAAQRARARGVTADTFAGEPRGAGTPRILDADYVAPRSELESVLAAVWGEVLGVAEVGRDDDFFELGGNSLVAVQLIAQIRAAVQVKLPMRSVFETSTVAGMAELVERARAEEPAEPPETPKTTIPRLARPE